MIASKLNLASDGFLPSAGLNRINGNPDRHFHPSSFTTSFPLHASLDHSGCPPDVRSLPTSVNQTTKNNFSYNSHSFPLYNSTSSHLSPIPQPDFSVSGASTLYRSVSADSATLPQSASHHHLVQRLAHQNAAIREAWEAERNYLEANRRRAEEVYQEERVIMDEVREGWENEKATMLHENQLLKERIQRLEGENHTLKTMAAQNVHISGVVSPQASLPGDSADNSANASSASGPSAFKGHISLHGLSHQHPHSYHQFTHGPLSAETDPNSLPPGLDGASRRPHFAMPGSSRTSPTGQPEFSPFIPLDPRMQPRTSTTKDFLNSSTDESDTPVPIIDVQEVDPKLDGIPLKATAVQKYTFGASESTNASPALSPPPLTQQNPVEQLRPDAIKRVLSKDHTFQVLQAEASRRLTMHAGHTPNHSLSRFPTLSIAASSTGAPHDDETSGQVSISAPYAPTEPEEEPEETRLATDDAVAQQTNEGAEEDHPEETMEAENDVKLKGPLMIRNIPAQDEIFWDQVNKKLEPISQGRDALPTVMRSSICSEVAIGAMLGLSQSRQVAPVGGDASHDTGCEVAGSEAEIGGRKGLEADISLKFRTTTNFGAPFGMA